MNELSKRNQLLKELGFDSYEDYLKSDLWRQNLSANKYWLQWAKQQFKDHTDAAMAFAKAYERRRGGKKGSHRRQIDFLLAQGIDVRTTVPE